MPETHVSVTLLAHTPNPLALVYAAFRQCYAPGSVAEMWPRLLNGEISRQAQADFVARILASGHTSPIEHVSFTFALSGVSRALTHQLVRHRLASYSQQSQRYVDSSYFDYVIPPRIAEQPECRKIFEECMAQIGDAYVVLKRMLERDGNAKEDARFVLPQAAASRIVVTMNCRSLINFFEQRTCMRAQWEIRGAAHEMLAICRGILPEIFAAAGPRCERLGYCPEGPFCCGHYPAKDATNRE